MSKSIFIIDTPACCGECPMSGTGVCRKWSLKEARTFPKDCPLKPAYDVDKVAFRLECESINCHIMTDRAVEIVKSGGTE